MATKEYAQGIYIKKFEGKYGDWLSVAIKEGSGYKRYKFYPKKEQKNDAYIEYYGVIDDWKPTGKSKQDELLGTDEIPY